MLGLPSCPTCKLLEAVGHFGIMIVMAPVPEALVQMVSPWTHTDALQQVQGLTVMGPVRLLLYQSKSDTCCHDEIHSNFQRSTQWKHTHRRVPQAHCYNTPAFTHDTATSATKNTQSSCSPVLMTHTKTRSTLRVSMSIIHSVGGLVGGKL